MSNRNGRQRGAWGKRTLWHRLDLSGGVDACWPVDGSHNPKGYGTASVEGRQMQAHRAAWALTHGPIPDGLIVMHTCDNPPCCNPSHLRLGTPAENTADMMAKSRDYWSARTHCAQGHAFAEFARVATRGNGKRYRKCMACHRLSANRKVQV